MELIGLDAKRTRKSVPATQIMGIVPLETIPSGHRMENGVWNPQKMQLAVHRIADTEFGERIRMRILGSQA
ncbi:hypothetical protein HY572_05515 [Candidatus Micrarchaeota archaeon]|nr:hypothetical protein [Candidatus Micrarchaeota archaeon]